MARVLKDASNPNPGVVVVELPQRMNGGATMKLEDLRAVRRRSARPATLLSSSRHPPIFFPPPSYLPPATLLSSAGLGVAILDCVLRCMAAPMPRRAMPHGPYIYLPGPRWVCPAAA